MYHGLQWLGSHWVRMPSPLCVHGKKNVTSQRARTSSIYAKSIEYFSSWDHYKPNIRTSKNSKLEIVLLYGQTLERRQITGQFVSRCIHDELIAIKKFLLRILRVCPSCDITSLVMVNFRKLRFRYNGYVTTNAKHSAGSDAEQESCDVRHRLLKPCSSTVVMVA